MEYTIELLDGWCDLESFDSGEPVLDSWLREHAATQSERQLSRTFVLIEPDHPRVYGYYTLAAHMIEQEQLGRRLGRGLPRQIPATLLARLAIDKGRQQMGLGGMLLAEAMANAADAGASVGARFMVVDAINEKAVAFYEHYGYTRVPDASSSRLVQRIGPALRDQR